MCHFHFLFRVHGLDSGLLPRQEQGPDDVAAGGDEGLPHPRVKLGGTNQGRLGEQRFALRGKSRSKVYRNSRLTCIVIIFKTTLILIRKTL